MEIYAGLDLHSNNSYIGICNEQGKRIKVKKMSNDKTKILEFLAPYKNAIKCLAFESTYNWYWLADMLSQAGYNIKMANPLAMQQYKGLKHTDDKSDAFWLAEMLRLNILPTGHIMEKEIRGIRDLLRYRLSMVQDRTNIKLALVSVYARSFGLNLNAKNARIFDLTQLGDDPSTIPVKIKIRNLIKRINFYDLEISNTEKIVENMIPDLGLMKLLTTIPRVGKILAMTILLEVGDIKRFQNVGSFTSYCRCTNASRFSNGKKKGANLSKCGNKYLSLAFCQAATRCRIFCKEAQRFYDRKRKTKLHILANKALATKLCKATFHILSDKSKFSIEKCFGYKIKK